MSNPIVKTERQRLEEERDVTLACMAICEAARVRVDQALKGITEERRKSISRGEKRVVSSLGRWQPNRQPQTNTPYSTSSKADGDTTSRSRHTNLAHRQRETQPHTKGLNEMGGRIESCGDSATGSQGEFHEESFVMVENPDEGEVDEGVN
jgi:hypothetical protein